MRGRAKKRYLLAVDEVRINLIMAQGVTTKLLSNDHSLFHGHCGRTIFHTVLKKHNSGIIFYFNL